MQCRLTYPVMQDAVIAATLERLVAPCLCAQCLCALRAVYKKLTIVVNKRCRDLRCHSHLCRLIIVYSFCQVIKYSILTWRHCHYGELHIRTFCMYAYTQGYLIPCIGIPLCHNNVFTLQAFNSDLHDFPL